ncbi:MAG: HesA/MoeB/ThiF family protein [Candidatus Micrarchaeia archaeon]
MPLSLTELKRYSRQLILPNFGAREQRRLKNARVVVTGAGGIGCPVLLNLAASGVGSITIIDSDSIDLTNLNRQFLFTPADVGRPKAVVAAERIRAFNPDIEVRPVVKVIDYSNAFDLLKGFDAIIDGTDNFAARYAINDAAVLNRTPLFHAAVLQYEGRVFTVIPGKSACLRCAFPVIPPKGSIPTCREAGVLGSVISVLAGIQATEAIKHLAGQGARLTDRMLVFDGRTMSFDEFRFRRRRECSACGQKGFTSSPVYQEVCDI